MKKITITLMSLLLVGLVAAAIITQPSKSFDNNFNINSVKVIDVDGEDFIEIDFTGTSKSVWDKMEACNAPSDKKVLIPYDESLMDGFIEGIESYDTSVSNFCPEPTPGPVVSKAGEQYDFADGTFKK